MYPELDNILGLKSDLPGGNVILLSDDFECDGCFALTHYISKYLKSKAKVLLINNLHGLNHYHQICLKFGLNLKLLRESQQFRAIYSLQRRYEELMEGSQNVGKENDLKQLYLEIKSAAESLSGDSEENVLIVIDNLTTFVNLGYSRRETVNFFNYCCQLTANRNYCLLIRATLASDEDDDSLVFKSIHRRANLKIKVAGLSTGFSRDVFGNVEIDSETEVDARHYQYHFQNSKLKLFPYGSVNAAL